MYYIDHYDSPFGGITLASDGETLNGLWFDGQKYFGDTLPSRGAQTDGTAGKRRRGRAVFRQKPDPLQEEATWRGAAHIFDQTREWLELYFHGGIPDFMPPLAMFQAQEEVQRSGRAFQAGPTTKAAGDPGNPDAEAARSAADGRSDRSAIRSDHSDMMSLGDKQPRFTRITPFRQSVWRVLLTIPYGETVTYGQIAEQLAKESGAEHVSAQAVGGAIGHNPVSVIVPCHRVLSSTGSLTGYAGGVDIKWKLLALEGVEIF